MAYNPTINHVAIVQAVRASFADSVEAFERYVACPAIGVAGVRLRPPFVESRYGVAVESFDEFSRLATVLEQCPPNRTLGVSIHLQSSQIGLARWKALVFSLLHEAAALEEFTGRRFQLLDLGGGHHPDDAEQVLSESLPELLEAASAKLPSLRWVILEPGKALVEPCAVVISTVLEVRRRGEGFREAVVDASIAELPLIDAYPHRFVAVIGDRLDPLLPGRDSILGRLCMENDILMPRVSLPETLKEGDRIAVCDAGAYDASMAYSFGTGRALDRSGQPAAEAAEHHTKPPGHTGHSSRNRTATAGIVVTESFSGDLR